MTSATPELLVTVLLVGPVVGALVVAALTPRAARLGASVVASGVQALAAVGLVAATLDGSRVVVDVGGHLPPLGVTLAVDLLAALAALVSTLVVLAVQVGLTGSDADRWRFTRPAVLLLSTGVVLAFSTADLFTLFVAFEVVLIASYVLVTRDGDRAGVLAAPAYVAANLVASALFLIAIAGIYGATGHVNLAGIAQAWPEVSAPLQALLGGMLLVVFAIKAALVPLGVWLPAAYAAVPPILGAAFAALLTKVGVVALLRVVTLLDIRTGTGADPLLLGIASITMVGGVVVAFGEKELHRILAAHVVSQVGFMILGLALFDVAGIAGAVLYLAHHVLVKGALLLVAASVHARHGTLRLDRLGGIGRQAPVLAGTFLVAAVALAGLPPTSGFVAKLSLLQAGISAEAWIAVGASLVASLLTMASMAKVHGAVFRSEPMAPVPGGALAARPALLGAAGLVLLGLVGASLAGPMAQASVVAAESLLDVPAYIEAVLR